MGLPYLTANLPGVGGSIKNRPEDFFVQELPLYEPCGQGEHVYCEIEKVGISTFEAIDRLARTLGVGSRDIGYAGMKDARAITRQVLSIWGAAEEKVLAAHVPGVKVLWARRHGNKLRLGHLAGNRFAIRIRDVLATDVVKLKPVLDVLLKRGVPNFFGEQRFGRRHDNHLLGAALIRGDDAGVLNLLLGSPNAQVDDAQTIGARKAFERGQYEQAMRLFPRRCGIERRILARFIKTANATAAVRAIDEKLRRLWVSALQSELFNDLLARRIDSLDQLLDGDLAMKHDNGACFLVEDAASEQARCDAFQISPTGPLVGYRLSLPAGTALALERQVMQAHALKPEDFRLEGRHKVKGARRPLRVQIKDVQYAGGVDEHGAYIVVAFTLPPGAFATIVLREVMKDQPESEIGGDLGGR